MDKKSQILKTLKINLKIFQIKHKVNFKKSNFYQRSTKNLDQKIYCIIFKLSPPVMFKKE